VQTDVLVAVVDELVGDEDVGQAGQAGEVGRIGLDGRILELLDHIAEALDQIVLLVGLEKRRNICEIWRSRAMMISAQLMRHDREAMVKNARPYSVVFGPTATEK